MQVQLALIGIMRPQSEPIAEFSVISEKSAPSPARSSDGFDIKGVSLITFAHALHDTYGSWLSALLPVLIEKFYLTNTMAGALSMVLTIPSVLQPFFGYIADRKNLRMLIVIAPVVTALVMTSLVVIPSYTLLFLSLLLAGVSAAAIHSVGPGVVSHFSGKSIGKGMSFWMIGGEFGFSVGPLLATSMVGLIGFSRMPLLAIGGFLVSAFLLQATQNVDTRTATKTFKINQPAFIQNVKSVMLPMILLLVTRALAGVMLSTFLPTFLKSQGASLAFAGAGMAIAGAAGAVGSFIAGSLSDKIGHRKVLLIAVVFTPIMMLLFLKVSGWMQILLLILCGFFGLSMYPVMMSAVMKAFSKDRSFANGIFMSVNFIIQATGAIIAGRIADLKGLPFAFTVGALIMPLGVLALLLMPRREAAEE